MGFSSSNSLNNKNLTRAIFKLHRYCYESFTVKLRFRWQILLEDLKVKAD